MTEADLLRENAELKEQNDQICELNLKVTASNARLRGALGSLRANVHGGIAVSDRYTLIDAMCLTNLRCIERELAEAEKVLAETPAESLAAIRDAAKRETVELLHSCQKEREQLAERLTAAEEDLDVARAEERKRYDELVDALCSPSWLGRNRHESVLGLARRLRNQQLEIRSAEAGTCHGGC